MQQTGGFQWEVPELPPIFGIFAVFVLVAANGFFVATEFSLVAVRKSRIEQLVAEGHRTAPAVRKALQNLDTYIAATQFGITIASLALGWVGEPALAHLIDPVLEAVVPPEWALTGSHAISVAISFALITGLHIVLGELAPKGIALQKPEATALFVTVPTSLFLRLFRPFIFALNSTGNFVLRLVGIRPSGESETVHSVDELRYLVHASREAGLLDRAEEEMVGRALSIGDLPVYRVMVPRTEMLSVPLTMSRDELLAFVGRYRHVRFPVYRNSQDDIVGVIHVTDVHAWDLDHPNEPFSMARVMRTPLFVPEAVKIDKVLVEMRTARTHTAIVVDEYGGVAGMVTLQDVVERIVGDIPEIDEDSPPDIQMLPDGSARVDGMVPLREIEERFGINTGNVAAETLGGFVLAVLGRVPEVGETLELPPYTLKVTAMDGHRVSEVRLSQ